MFLSRFGTAFQDFSSKNYSTLEVLLPFLNESWNGESEGSQICFESWIRQLISSYFCSAKVMIDFVTSDFLFSILAHYSC